MEIKDILINLRKENNYTQKQIAEILEMSPSGYASWEQGVTEPNITAIKKICKIYDVSANYLLGLED